MGDATVRITQAVSVLVLLPLLYTMISSTTPHSSCAESESSSSEKAEPADDALIKPARSFILLVLCWLLAFYPFYSKMNASFGPSRICHTCVITPQDFGNVEKMCTAHVSSITKAEDALMTAFEMLSYIPLSVFILGRILWLGLEKHHHNSKLYTTSLDWCREHVSEKAKRRSRIGCLVAIPLLACGLLWTVLRAQQFQQQLSKTTGSGDSDAQWTFGQVVAVTVFAPVIVECWSAYQDGRQQDEGTGGSVDSDRLQSPKRTAVRAKTVGV
ncbi:hypothetical protein LTR65_002108 [Meristemomyces frigidus]